VRLGGLNRRAGRDYELLPPKAAIDPSEDAVSIEATYAMRASFAASDLAPAVLKFFDALVDLLPGRNSADSLCPLSASCRRSGSPYELHETGHLVAIRRRFPASDAATLRGSLFEAVSWRSLVTKRQYPSIS
jgi:hypothetical protein